MTAQWRNFTFWVGAILVIVIATVLYQPAAAKTGSLLVWTRNRVYVMDIDTLDLQRVGPATPDQTITPSPGCLGQTHTPCWVLIDEAMYQVDLSLAGSHTLQGNLPVGEVYQWAGGDVSWSPDGVHLAYSVVNKQSKQAELRLYDATTNEVKITDSDVDPDIAVAWTSGCVNGLEAVNCRLGYKKKTSTRADDESLATLVGYAPASGAVQQWSISAEPVFELRWASDGMLLYSRPKRHFLRAEDDAPAYHIPAGAKLANMSSDVNYTVYYQPFTLEGCQAQDKENGCLNLGVWFTQSGDTEAEPSLIYNMNLSEAEREGGLNFIPIWSPKDNAFVLFQEGRLIH